LTHKTKTETKEPDKVNYSQPCTANDQNDWTAWTAAGLFDYSLPVRNQRLEERRCRMCHIVTDCKVLF